MNNIFNQYIQKRAMGVHYREVQWEGGAVDGGSIM